MREKLIRLGGILGIAFVAIVLVVFIISTFFGNKSPSAPTTFKGVTLEFWNVYDTTDQIMPLLKTFAESNGLRVNYKSFTDLATYKDTLLKELAAGGGPQVTALHYSDLSELSRIIAPPPSGMGITPESVASQYVDAVSQGVLLPFPAKDQQGRDIVTTQVAGLPLYVETPVLYYNKALFKNVLARPNPTPGETWEQIISDAVSLTAANPQDSEGMNIAGFAMGRADTVSRAVDSLLSVYLQMGGQAFVSQGQAQFSKQQVRDGSSTYVPGTTALDLLTSFARDGSKYQSWNAKLSKGADLKEVDAFARGKLAMMIGYSFTRGDLDRLIASGKASITADDIGVAPFPQVNAAVSGKTRTLLADYFVLTVPRAVQDPQRQAAAWTLIQYLTSPDVQLQYASATGKVSGRRDVLTREQQDSRFSIPAKQAVLARAFPVSADARTLLGTLMTAIADDQLAVQKAAERFDVFLQSKVNK